jgi:hypothetical protein
LGLGALLPDSSHHVERKNDNGINLFHQIVVSTLINRKMMTFGGENWKIRLNLTLDAVSKCHIDFV